MVETHGEGGREPLDQVQFPGSEIVSLAEGNCENGNKITLTLEEQLCLSGH